MFYRQKINELCYMYVYLGTVQCLCMYYVVKLSVDLHVRRPSSFSRIRLDHAFLPGPPHRFCLLVVPISRFVAVFQLPVAPPRAASVVVSGQLQQSKYRAAIFDPRSITQLPNYCACHNTALSQHTSTYRVCSITTVVSPSFVNFFVID